MKTYFKLEIISHGNREVLKRLIEEIPGVEVSYIEEGLNWSKDKTIQNFMKTVITALSAINIEAIDDVDTFSSCISCLRIQENAYYKFISEGLVDG